RLSSPTPLPPKTQLSHIPARGVSPASGLRLSCVQLTEPQPTAVVLDTNVGLPAPPKRSSLPSRLPVRSWSTGRSVRASKAGVGCAASQLLTHAVSMTNNASITL